ncbi:hypothetical protein TCAL_04588 [Tigriopus californicus]|uniref:Uncharacterized protein n=1 Tax=Tigriopus californicus TaxID=6832 RepID=A0A553PCT3_TIGCA|nr:uncharacterized protein LOC131892793 [Tigriopus californicus]TRY75478.1 hypothetical protein TCAL_04588 [Tigriopus californicus]|eukprot:TCALIF_04588-PA protein Name:"Protein of unknown function" AED:0.00 eAED:0.00 QI:0/1/0.5/1/1/1/2/78/336
MSREQVDFENLDSTREDFEEQLKQIERVQDDLLRELDTERAKLSEYQELLVQHQKKGKFLDELRDFRYNRYDDDHLNSKGEKFLQLEMEALKWQLNELERDLQALWASAHNHSSCKVSQNKGNSRECSKDEALKGLEQGVSALKLDVIQAKLTKDKTEHSIQHEKDRVNELNKHILALLNPRKPPNHIDVDQICIDSMDLRRKIEQVTRQRNHSEVLLELNRDQVRNRRDSGLLRYSQVAKILQDPNLDEEDRRDCLRNLTLALLEVLQVKDCALDQQLRWNKSLGTRLQLLNQKRPGLIKDEETPILDLPTQHDVQVDFQQPQTTNKPNLKHSYL